MSVVSMRKTKDHSYESIREAVRTVVADLGGLSDIIKPGYKVILNPNLVAVPADRLSGGVTRWEVVKAVAELVKEEGAEPIIAESAAAGVDTEEVIQKCGYGQLREEGYQVIDLKKQKIKKIPVENGKIVEELTTWDIIADADAIISIPVMKTHDQTEVTLGLKNLKGLIADGQKKLFHTLGVVPGVIDIIQTVKPVLCIIDGTYGQQGLGPIFGETVEMKLIVGSKDIVACDAVTSAVMGYDIDAPMLTVEAYSRGLGEKDINKIEIKGETIEGVYHRFKRASEVEIPGLPPYTLIFDENACTGCHNTVISSLMDLKNGGYAKYLEGKIIAVGPVKELPPEATPENTVLIGKCTRHLKEKGRWVPGCPPGNVFVVQAIVGDAEKVSRAYSDKDEDSIQ